MKGITTIIRKEFARVFKDRKLVFSLFILPAVIVIGSYFIMGQMMDNLTNDVEQHISSVYIQNAPKGLDTIVNSSGYGETASITYIGKEENTKDIETGILDGSIDLLVTFPEDFINIVNNYKQLGDSIPDVTLNYNTTGNYSSVAKGNFETMVLSNFETDLLTNRFGNIEALTVFHVESNVIVNEDKANGEMLAMLLPYFITFLLFAGAMGIGIDAITGEKERGTMAKLLLSPIKRTHIVVGKLISLSALSGLSAIVYALAMIIAMPMMGKTFGGGDDIPFAVSFSVSQMIELLAIMLVMVYLYVCIVSLLAVIAKTAREAQAYIAPLYILVFIAGMATMFQGGMEKPMYQYAIPVYGNSIAIQNLMTNELTLSQFGLSIVGTVGLAIIVTFLISKAFSSEKVMFNA